MTMYREGGSVYSQCSVRLFSVPIRTEGHCSADSPPVDWSVNITCCDNKNSTRTLTLSSWSTQRDSTSSSLARAASLSSSPTWWCSWPRGCWSRPPDTAPPPTATTLWRWSSSLRSPSYSAPASSTYKSKLIFRELPTSVRWPRLNYLCWRENFNNQLQNV